MTDINLVFEPVPFQDQPYIQRKYNEFMGNDKTNPFGTTQAFDTVAKKPRPPQGLVANIAKIPSRISNRLASANDMNEDTRMGYHCSNIFCSSRLKKLLLTLLIASAILSTLSAAFYFVYRPVLYGNLNILCIGYLREASMYMGIIAGALIVAGIIFFPCYCFMREKSRDRAKCVIYVAFFTFFILILVNTIFVNVVPTHMLVKDPKTNNYYHCEAENFPMVAYPILFSLDSCNSSQPNQICQFRSVTNLCEVDLRSFKTFSQLISVNGTLGACHCQSPNPEGLQICQNYFHEFEKYPILIVVCSFLSIVTYCLTCTGIRLQDNPEAHDRLVDCCVHCGCTCCEPLRPLISERSYVHESTINI